MWGAGRGERGGLGSRSHKARCTVRLVFAHLFLTAASN